MEIHRYVQTTHVHHAYIISVKRVKFMFRSFGCDDNFRLLQHHDRECKRDDFHREDLYRRSVICNVLANIAIV